MSTSFGDRKLMLLGTAALATSTICAYAWYRRHQSNQPPKKWMKVGEVSDLCLYPVKSCKALKSADLECTPLGSKIGELRDRMFVVVNEEGNFVTGRDYPNLLQVGATMSKGKLKLSAGDGPEGLEFDFRGLKGDKQSVRIWNAPAEGIDCGDDVARWLSQFILKKDTGLRLLYFGDRNESKGMNPKMSQAVKHTKRDFRKSDSALFSDSVSYHLISDVSVAELNSRMDEKVSALNFRPNIVVKGDALLPFEEDAWDWVKIGDVVFRFLSPCTRCLFTTIDPDTCKKSENMEPVKTLRKYRFLRDSALRKIFQSSPAMGIYLGARSEGIISVGDDVMIPDL